MENSRRKFLLGGSSALVGLFLPETSEAQKYSNPSPSPSPTAYTHDEYSFLEGQISAQQDRLIQFEKEGKPIKKAVFAIEPYEKFLVTKAWEYKVPEYIAIGVAVLENGGRTDAVSRAGCRGIMQLSEGVAKTYKIRRRETVTVVTGSGKKRKERKKTIWIDERDNPEKNIDVGLRYLRDIHGVLFPNWDLAAQAYHTGPGRIQQAISTFIKSTKKKHVPWKAVGPSIVNNYEINWSRLMLNRQTFRFFQRLNDETEFYLPKALACYRIYSKRSEIFA